MTFIPSTTKSFPGQVFVLSSKSPERGNTQVAVTGKMLALDISRT